MDFSNEFKKGWWSSFVAGIKEDFKLRKVLMPIRKGDMSSKIKKEDRLQIKSNIFISNFLLFNASLVTLYVSSKSKQAMRSVTIPLAFVLFTVFAYKL